MIPEFQSPFSLSSKLDFELSYQAIISEIFDSKRPVILMKQKVKSNKIVVERNTQKEANRYGHKGQGLSWNM